jgi:HNH endonuclease
MKKAKQQFMTNRNRADYYGVENSLVIEEWLDILRASEGRCYYCHTHVGQAALLIEHKIPLIQGGANSADNVVAACRHCNQAKGSYLTAADLLRIPPTFQAPTSPHTPEPWVCRYIQKALDIMIVQQGRGTDGNVARVQASGTGTIEQIHERNRANARRITACVNACIGIPTEALERIAAKRINHYGAGHNE